MEENLKYLAALSHFPKFGPKRLGRLLDFFSTPAAAFGASLSQLIQAGLEENIAHEFLAFRPGLVPDKIAAVLAKEKIAIVAQTDPAYPKLLNEIHDAPPLLYVRGAFSPRDEFSLAVVGSRKCTRYGEQAVTQIVRELAQSRFTIVSGLALGIDALAHRTTIEADGRTIAVLGSGLDQASIYPTANRYLAEQIVKNGGAVISEFPLGTAPLRHNFPQRNRLIAGLSLGTLVVEAGEKSGALITAAHALDQNREVFALPGPIYSPASYGPNKLIQDGARVVTKAADIIEALDLREVSAYINNKTILPSTEEEETIMANLGFEPVHIDELVRLSRLDTARASSTLVMMEMKGLIKNLGGMMYVLAR